ncbi:MULTISPECIES: hypothetical protein [unclassified Limnobacter]|jgi:2C-methyl-D-erythritol 2,4-cyclodiphosphate synthase|uniref:hypothetical protein n=1 Tax=unclassified Limnobacter TaxID=2630203 RepID=UPI000C62C93E|nr:MULTISPECIES: hypothetical protein [unclassified Limnobacter]MAG79711.1 hypothetical protein [Sutterellaceae bacterium]MBA4315676.1 hypothetical protein [Alcaligenaceae bacterium]MBT85607.1 hypothetical protein [Sutterellaceae bacterium]RZO93720.1 MAG: hypothetical protein EVA59_05175 [Limnobacter sp.]HAV74426.1 hypothetical protein [Limnobacter sp.]|tara:strand:- start:178 stop:489 length:312 start_codon:yes stop_codon:yes gene_type:complete
MNARQLIATSVLAISASVPAVVMANPATQQGDGTSHVVAAESQRNQATRQAVLNEYQKAVQTGEFSPAAGDASVTVQTAKSTVTRAEVISKINGVDLTEGDAS